MDELLISSEQTAERERDIRQALIHFQRAFMQAGLSPREVYAAMDEFEPVLRELVVPYDKRPQVPARLGLSPTQASAVQRAQSEFVADMELHYRRQVWKSLKVIAGLIGRQNFNS